MTSKEVEDKHLADISNLLAASGIECARSAKESEETESEMVEEEDRPATDIGEAEHAEVVEEEEKPASIAEVEEETPYVFPTPSLRRILPERIRNLEGYNRLHVLPDDFNTAVDPAAIPKIAQTPPQNYIDVLAELTGCSLYKSSLAEYWFLDTLANMLRRAQEDLLDRAAQAVLILWFCEWMKEMQYFDAADRKRMLRRFEDNMMEAAAFVADEQRLPTPGDIGVYYKGQDEQLAGGQDATSKVFKSPTEQWTLKNSLSTKSSVNKSSMDSKHLVTFEGAAYLCSLRDLATIIHYIFDLFSTDYQYDLVRSIFTNNPQYTLIDAPYRIQLPKSFYVVSKGKAKGEKSPKKEKDKGKGKAVKKEEDNPEYLALMELKERELKELAAIEERDREAWVRRCQILPLNLAADDNFFNAYWPPPPVELDTSVSQSEAKSKPKGKGK